VLVYTQARAHLPTTALTLEPSDSQLQQQQQQQQGAGSDLPAVLKSSRTPVDMSLVLKAARDVPLHLLASEYEKVGACLAGSCEPCKPCHVLVHPLSWGWPGGLPCVDVEYARAAAAAVS
jgi:hypothetical protein